MKASTNKIIKTKNLKDSSLNKSSKISNYFKSAPKNDLDESNRPGDANSIYIQALKKKLKSYTAESEKENYGPEQNNFTEKDESVNEEATEDEQEDGACAIVSEHALATNAECVGCSQWKVKYNDLKKLYLKLSLRYGEIEMKYDDLSKTKTGSFQPGDTASVALIDDVFLSRELILLRNISLDKKYDSSFIHQCMEFAYKDKLIVLRGKTLKGKPELIKISEDGEVEFFAKKDPLTPKKVDRIKELFLERILKCELNSVSFGERVKDTNINKLFASAVNNISKKQK